MINMFNRRELILTHSMDRQAEVRAVLSANGIDYQVKTINRPNQRGHRGSLGIDSDYAYEYKIYAHQKDYEQAKHLIQTSK